MNKASNSMRVWFALFALVIFLGIYLTGIASVHWLLYVPAIGFVFAAVSGICPSQIIVSNLFGGKK